MSNVRFRNVQCNDDRLPYVQETSIRRVPAFAGVHDIAFLTAVSEAFASGTLAANNLEDDEGTWSVTDGELQGIGDGLAQWYKIRHTTEVEVGFVATFDKTGDNGGLLFNCDDDYKGYLVWWTGSAVGVSSVSDATTTTLLSLPLAETGNASVIVAVIPRRHSSIDTIDDLSVCLWFDGRHLLTHTLPYSPKGEKLGFAVYQSNMATFDNLRVAQLHQPVEWASVDPGEAAGAGLSRVIGYEQIKTRARYDGSVQVWRNTGSDTDWTLPDGRSLAETEEQQLYPPSHYRLVGALHEVDVFRAGSQGHVFTVGQDPNALTIGETYQKAGRQHKLAQEEARINTVTLAPNPALEPEDVVSIDGVTWRVISINYRAAWRGGQGGTAPVLESNITLRECL